AERDGAAEAVRRAASSVGASAARRPAARFSARRYSGLSGRPNRRRRARHPPAMPSRAERASGAGAGAAKGRGGNRGGGRGLRSVGDPADRQRHRPAAVQGHIAAPRLAGQANQAWPAAGGAGSTRPHARRGGITLKLTNPTHERGPSLTRRASVAGSWTSYTNRKSGLSSFP